VFLSFADLETRVDQLKASKTNMKNIVYQEKDAHEVLELEYNQLSHECVKHMELREASDRDLVNCYKSLHELHKDWEKLAANSRSLKKPHSRLQGCWYLIEACPR
jgi:chromosome segregation ATPase